MKQIAFCSLLRRCSETIITFEGFGWEANFWPPPFLILHSEQATRPLIWNIGNLHMYNTLSSGNINLEVQRAQRSLSGAHHYQSGYPSCLLGAQGVRQSRCSRSCSWCLVLCSAEPCSAEAAFMPRRGCF